MERKSNLKPSSASKRERFFERLSQTDTYASRRLKEKVQKREEGGNLSFNIENQPNLQQDRFFDRLSQTETYASRGLKEKVLKPKQEGRTLFNIENQPNLQYIHDVKGSFSSRNKQNSSSNNTLSTCSSPLSFSRTSKNSSYNHGSSGTVFDRLASTGTKSSLGKHKESEFYVEKENTFAESKKHFHYRQDKGREIATSVIIRNNKWDDGIERISFYPNRGEAEI